MHHCQSRHHLDTSKCKRAASPRLLRKGRGLLNFLHIGRIRTNAKTIEAKLPGHASDELTRLDRQFSISPATLQTTATAPTLLWMPATLSLECALEVLQIRFLTVSICTSQTKAHAQYRIRSLAYAILSSGRLERRSAIGTLEVPDRLTGWRNLGRAGPSSARNASRTQ